MIPQFLSSREVAHRLGIASRTLDRYRYEGKGPAYHSGLWPRAGLAYPWKYLSIIRDDKGPAASSVRACCSRALASAAS